jgi:hypothetical protein
VLESCKDDKTRIIHAQKHGDFNSESEQEQLEKGRRHKRQRTLIHPALTSLEAVKRETSVNKVQVIKYKLLLFFQP